MPVGGRTGQPYPSRTRIHRTLTSAFASGAAFTIATPITAEIPIAGQNYTLLYFKANQAGTLKFEFMRPYPFTTVYNTKPIPDVTTVADTEKVVLVPVEGESRLKITFTPDATGTITFADIMFGDVAAQILDTAVRQAGIIRPITGTNPAAGVEIIETVPTGKLWRLLSMSFQLVTGAGGSARTVSVVLDDGTNEYSHVTAFATQAISTTRRYTFSEAGLGGGTIGAINILIPHSSSIIQPAGHRIRTDTFNGGAADEFDAPHLLVEEFDI